MLCSSGPRYDLAPKQASSVFTNKMSKLFLGKNIKKETKPCCNFPIYSQSFFNSEHSSAVMIIHTVALAAIFDLTTSLIGTFISALPGALWLRYGEALELTVTAPRRISRAHWHAITSGPCRRFVETLTRCCRSPPTPFLPNLSLLTATTFFWRAAKWGHSN